jgi:microcystin-dependent protein
MNTEIGEIRMFAFNFARRDSRNQNEGSVWALCDGRLLKISDHELLSKALGTTYGGDGVGPSRCPTCAAERRCIKVAAWQPEPGPG